MTTRQVSVLVADDALYNLTGKLFLQGVYVTEIIIPSDPANVPQLVFMFLIETDITDPFKSLTLQVTLPGESPVNSFIPILPGASQILPPGRTKIHYRWPLIVQMPVLRQGKIDAKIIHESGELGANAPWIVLASRPPATH